MPRPVHFELPADDPERLIRFYRDVLGWRVEKFDGPMEYWMVYTGETSEPGIDGGIYRREPGGGSTVNTIGVEDLDATLAAVAAHGGTITQEKYQLPGVGWLATCLDTDGNAFGLIQPEMVPAT